MSGITDPSASNAYLVKVEPGIYDLEASSLFMRPFVDIEGSGEGITTITSALGSGSGTVVGANNSELRYLTVKNTGEAGQQVVAIFTRERIAPPEPRDRHGQRRSRELRRAHLERDGCAEVRHRGGNRRRPGVRGHQLQQPP